MTDIYFTATENCNFSCSHCCFEAKPKQKDKTISEKDFEKMVKNFPKDSTTLGLSGGELFTIKNKLYSFLDIVQEENKNRKKKITMNLQSNGFWATSKKRTEKILEELKEKGISRLEIASRDPFHFRDKSFNPETLGNLSFFEKQKGLPALNIRGGPKYIKNLFPMGNAKNLVKNINNSWVNWDDYCSNFLEERKINVDYQGNVFACCLRGFPLEGNLIETPLLKILKYARADKTLEVLSKKGILKAAKSSGKDQKKVKTLIEKNGSCIACYKTFKDENPFW